MPSDIQLNEENIVITCPEGLRVEGCTEIAGDIRAEKGAEVIGNLQVSGGKTVSIQMASGGHETFFHLADDGIANLHGNRVAITNFPISAGLDLFPDGQVSLGSSGKLILHGATVSLGSTGELRLECSALVVRSATGSLEFESGTDQPMSLLAVKGLTLYLGGEPGGQPRYGEESQQVTDLDDPETCSPAEVVGDILISWPEYTTEYPYDGPGPIRPGYELPGAAPALGLAREPAQASPVYKWVTYKVSVRKMWRDLRSLTERVAALERR